MRASFEIGKIDNIESCLVRRLEDDGRRADRWLQRSNRASSGSSQVENHVHGLTVCQASCRLGQACYHHHPPKNPAAYADLVGPASLLVLDAPNLYRDIVQELRGRRGLPRPKAYSESDHWGGPSSVQARRRSSEPQVVTVQLVDGPAAHQLHVAFDFGSEIFKRPFNAGLTRGRQSI
jgi:hypothetical protein